MTNEKFEESIFLKMIYTKITLCYNFTKRRDMMEVARKPFEYYEDKKGPILYFIILVLLFDIIGAIIGIVQTDDIIRQIAILNISFKGIGILFILSIPYVAAICYKLNKRLVKIAKIYLIIRSIYLSSIVFILFFHNMSDASLIGADKKYETFGEFMRTELLFPLGFVLLMSVVWFLYFQKSKRCKEIAAENGRAI
jgi:uncharacterized membrane protein